MHFTVGNNQSNFLYAPLVRDNFYFTASTAFYGMKLKHLDTNQEKIFLMEDVSAAADAFQKFQITTTGSTAEILSAATVSLNVGTHEFTFYPATAQTIASISTQILNRGYFELTSSTTSVDTYTAADEDEVIVYGQ